MTLPVLYWQGGDWILREPWSVQVNGFWLHIPEGFRFDLSSIPRPLRVLVDRTELGVRAPLVHDFIYRYRGSVPVGTIEPARSFTRAEADRLFLWIMGDAGIGRVKRTLAWLGVRLFGWVPWPPERSLVRAGLLKALNTGWQAALAMLLVDGWWVPLVAAGLSAVKSVLVPWIRATVRDSVY